MTDRTPPASVAWEAGAEQNSGEDKERQGRHKRAIDGTTDSGLAESVTNPFDSCLLDSLHSNTFSPSIFAKIPSPILRESRQEEQAEFRWSIEHIAILNPASIDPEEVARFHTSESDPHLEARIHQAIEQFWSTQKHVAPSPEGNFPNNNNDNNVTNADENGVEDFLCHDGTTSEEAKTHLKNAPSASTAVKKRPVTRGLRQQLAGRQQITSPLVRTSTVADVLAGKNKESQTLLTFPPLLDLERLLGGRFQYDEEVEEDGFEEANLSVNTLRRKLFAEGDEQQQQQDQSMSSQHFQDEAEIGTEQECGYTDLVLSSSRASQGTIMQSPMFNYSDDDDEDGSVGEDFEGETTCDNGTAIVNRSTLLIESPNLSPIK